MVGVQPHYCIYDYSTLITMAIIILFIYPDNEKQTVVYSL